MGHDVEQGVEMVEPPQIIVRGDEFQRVWETIVSEATLPRRFRNLHEISYAEFRQKVLERDREFVETMPRLIYAGDALLIRGAFTKSFIVWLKEAVTAWCRQRPSGFYKMVEGCPDFHRKIDEEAAKKYSFKGLKHACYFYPWNDDPLKIFPTVWDRWGLCKVLSGQRFDEFCRNTPKDEVIDRIQVVRYPSGAGVLETHSDPYLHQRLIISGYMSTRGEDFETGGFYMIGPDDQRVDMEDRIDAGDMLIAYATVLHGVGIVDAHKPVDWDSTQGRWFLSMYSNASDEVANRHTGYAVKLTSER